MENIGLFDLDFSSDFYIEKMEKFLISRSFLEAIGWMTIARYAAVLVLEFGICILLFNAKIARRAFLMVAGLVILGVFLRDPVLCGIWFNLVIVVTGVFANTKLGFAAHSLNPQPKLKINPVLKNLLAWLVLFALTYTLWAGSIVASAALREPQTVQRKIWFLSHEQNGDIQIAFKEENAYFSTRISKGDPSPFSEGDCLKLTYYETPLSSVDIFGLFQKYVIKIESGDQCP